LTQGHSLGLHGAPGHPWNRTFLLCTNRTFSFCGDSENKFVDEMSRRTDYLWRQVCFQD
jgi:hypothetical protein